MLKIFILIQTRFVVDVESGNPPPTNLSAMLCNPSVHLGKKIEGNYLTIHQTNLCFNPLPDDKILDGSKFKQIADDI